MRFVKRTTDTIPQADLLSQRQRRYEDLQSHLLESSDQLARQSGALQVCMPLVDVWVYLDLYLDSDPNVILIIHTSCVVCYSHIHRMVRRQFRVSHF